MGTRTFVAIPRLRTHAEALWLGISISHVARCVLGCESYCPPRRVRRVGGGCLELGEPVVATEPVELVGVAAARGAGDRGPGLGRRGLAPGTLGRELGGRAGPLALCEFEPGHQVTQ